VPSFTFAAVAAAVCYTLAQPVFVDADPSRGTMSHMAVKNAISCKTKAIIVVHNYGMPAHMDEITALAKKHSIALIEDCAEAHGAMYKGRIVGSLGTLAVFSFYGNKIITTGEGGIVLTDDLEMASKMKYLKSHAMLPHKRFWHDEIGYNCKMTNLQAAIGYAQVMRLPEILRKRAHVLDMYRCSLLEAKFPGLRINFRSDEEGTVSVPWLVSVILPETAEQWMRDLICLKLEKRGISTRPFFYPLHTMPPYKDFRCIAADGSATLAVTTSLSTRGFSIPSSGNLTEEDVGGVLVALDKLLTKYVEKSIGFVGSL